MLQLADRRGRVPDPPGEAAELAVPRLPADRLSRQRHVRGRAHDVPVHRAVPDRLGLLARDAGAPRADLPAAPRNRPPLPAGASGCPTWSRRPWRSSSSCRASTANMRLLLAVPAAAAAYWGVALILLVLALARASVVGGTPLIRQRARILCAAFVLGYVPPILGTVAEALFQVTVPVSQRPVEAHAPVPRRHGLRHGPLRPLRRARGRSGPAPPTRRSPGSWCSPTRAPSPRWTSS